MNQLLHYIPILLLILMSLSSKSQENTCAFKLEEAEALYETGILDSIPSILRSCISNDGFDDEELSRAYKLLILTYLFEDYQEMAELTMLKFLKEFPEYELKATDPVEFTFLYNSYQTIPSWSIGIIAGGNYSFARIIEPYYMDNSNEYKGEYKTGISFQAGLQLKKYITDEIDINLDIMYTAKTFEYSIEQINTTTNYLENQSLLSVPLSGTYDFNYGKWDPYVRIGISLDYLLGAKADFEKIYPSDQSQYNIKETDVDIIDDRNLFQISALIGGGVKYNIKMGYVMLDVRYHYNFTNIVNGENRNSSLKWANYNYIDDDFTVNNIYFSLGFVYPFYKTKQSK